MVKRSRTFVHQTKTNRTMKKSAIRDQRRLKFLQETIDFYSPDPAGLRAVEHNKNRVDYGRCCYRTEDGRSCAIGRVLPKNRYNQNMETCAVGSVKVWPRLPVVVKSLGATFLSYVQTLHDDGSYWAIAGLSDLGQDFVAGIKQKIQEGFFDN